jgi:Family of unknown function (DUF5320)
MPAFDGTGPMGAGPMTGGGKGWCRTYYAGIRPPVVGYRFPPFDWGIRFGFAALPAFPSIPPYYWHFRRWSYGGLYSPRHETRFLKDEARMRRKGLEKIEVRIRELEKDRGMVCGEPTTMD